MTDHRTILIIEDDIATACLIAEFLCDEGFTVHTACDANAGALLVRESAPDLIVTDIRMPGTSGLEFIQALRRDGVMVPIGIMTADRFPDDLSDDVAFCLFKPFTLDALLTYVTTYCRSVPRRIT